MVGGEQRQHAPVARQQALGRRRVAGEPARAEPARHPARAGGERRDRGDGGPRGRGGQAPPPGPEREQRGERDPERRSQGQIARLEPLHRAEGSAAADAAEQRRAERLRRDRDPEGEWAASARGRVVPDARGRRRRSEGAEEPEGDRDREHGPRRGQLREGGEAGARSERRAEEGQRVRDDPERLLEAREGRAVARGDPIAARVHRGEEPREQAPGREARGRARAVARVAQREEQRRGGPVREAGPERECRDQAERGRRRDPAPAERRGEQREPRAAREQAHPDLDLPAPEPVLPLREGEDEQRRDGREPRARREPERPRAHARLAQPEREQRGGEKPAPGELQTQVPVAGQRQREHQRARHHEAVLVVLGPEVARPERPLARCEEQRHQVPVVEQRDVLSVAGHERGRGGGRDDREQRRRPGAGTAPQPLARRRRQIRSK
jgi:hypothetical protein